MPAKPTRQRILEILATRHAANTTDLARMLHVTPANVRHHLRQLAGDGLIQRVGTRTPEGRGRPGEVFTLTGARDNLEGLAARLLDQFLGAEPDSPGVAALAARFVPEAGNPSRHITQRLLSAVQHLETLNYQPRWEARAGAPQVIFGNCPYAELVADHPLLCQMDALILERLLHERVTLTEKLMPNREGLPICRFSVGAG